MVQINVLTCSRFSHVFSVSTSMTLNSWHSSVRTSRSMVSFSCFSLISWSFRLSISLSRPSYLWSTTMVVSLPTVSSISPSSSAMVSSPAKVRSDGGGQMVERAAGRSQAMEPRPIRVLLPPFLLASTMMEKRV